MHLLQLFLTAWLTLGTVTVVLLFWLCKRTATTVEDLPKRSGAKAVPDAQPSQALSITRKTAHTKKETRPTSEGSTASSRNTTDSVDGNTQTKEVYSPAGMGLI